MCLGFARRLGSDDGGVVRILFDAGGDVTKSLKPKSTIKPDCLGFGEVRSYAIVTNNTKPCSIYTSTKCMTLIEIIYLAVATSTKQTTFMTTRLVIQRKAIILGRQRTELGRNLLTSLDLKRRKVYVGAKQRQTNVCLRFGARQAQIRKRLIQLLFY